MLIDFFTMLSDGRAFVFAALMALLFISVAAEAQDSVRDLVVKIHTTRREPDLVRPWTKQNPVNVSGSGIVIDGKRILTNAHMV
ncbi:MAG TPA: hypothetical protein VGH16_07595, partial [Candidatus Binatia bacterium]